MRSSLFRKLFISVLGIFLFLLVVQWAVIGRFFKEIYLKSIVASQRAELSTAISRFSEADENYGLRQHALDTGSYIMVLRSDYTFGDQQFMDRMGSVSLSLEDSSIMVSTASFGSYPYQPSFLRGEKACVTAMQLGCSNYYEPLIVTTGGTSYTNLDAVHDYKNQAGSNGASTHEINGVGIVAPSQNFAFGANGKKDANFFLHQRMLPCLLYRLPIDETLAELTRRLIPSEDGVEYMVYSEARMVGNTLCYFITARQIILTGQEQIYFDRMLYIVYAILGVLLIIAAWLLSRYLSWPLVQLSEATRSLSHLDFSHQVSIRRNDELGLLSDSINDMADSLSEALRELRAANDRARNNEVRMQKLLADLAHVFKTPLFIISSYTEALESGIAADSDNAEKYYSYISNEVNRLSELVNEVIELSRIQMGTWRVKIEPWDLYDVVQMTIEKFQERFVNGGYTVKWTADDVTVLMDPRRIEQVLTNLLSNALKYTGEEKRIEVYTQRTNSYITVWVCNTGKLSRTDRERIWNRYYKRDSSKLSLLPSDGIGLDIVKTILKAHNSQYGVVQSDGMVRFYFTLRLEE